jgi:glycosyltransferase involved in cell wall biosynthesis
MLSGSHAQHDARVRKSAATLARSGYRVSVVAPSPTGERFDQDGGGWWLLNVPVGRQARDRAIRWPVVGRLGYRDEDAAHSALVSLSGTGARGGVGRRLRRRWVRFRTLVMRYRRSRRFYSSRWTRPIAGRVLQVPAFAHWRRLAPESVDLEAAFGPLVDRLGPDLLQSHDVQTINVAAAAAQRAVTGGRRVRWIYDAHEYVAGLTSYPPERLIGLVGLEAAFIRDADAVITVCEPIADHLLSHYGLRERPAVVLNAPLLDSPPLSSAASAGAAGELGRSLRCDVGLGPDSPIVVYSGKLDADRGIGDLVSALAYLPAEVHVVLITNRAETNTYLAKLRAGARLSGTTERLHTVPYVQPQDLVGYLSEATIGFAGFSHIGNHEVALPNKFFDYLHAGVPMVVSDLKLLGPLVRSLGVGQVYSFGDPGGLAAAIERVLADHARYAAATSDPDLRRRYSWQAQEPTLVDVYHRLVAPRAAVPRE